MGMAKMNMILHGYECSDIQQGDTLNNPQFLSSPTALQTFNYVVANPPFSQKSWLKSAKENDMFERWGNGVVDMEEGSRTPSSIGVPPEKMAITPSCFISSSRWLLMVRAHAFCLMVFCSVAMQRVKSARTLSRLVISRDSSDYHKSFYGTGIPACIIILDKQEASDRKGIFMIDAKDGFVRMGI